LVFLAPSATAASCASRSRPARHLRG
jgi:hypothetical protein